MKTYVVFRHLSPTRGDATPARPVLGHSGKPLVFASLRAAILAADKMDLDNQAGIGGYHCKNIRFTAGWLPEVKP